MRTAKTLIRLGGCPGWSESSLGAEVVLLVWSYRRRYIAKKKKVSRQYFSCSIEHGWKFIAAQCMFGNMDYLTIWLYGRADHIGFWWMMRHFKHKRCSFLFSQIKIAESECKKKMHSCERNRKLGQQYLRSYTDELIFTKLQRSNRFCKESS